MSCTYPSRAYTSQGICDEATPAHACASTSTNMCMNAITCIIPTTSYTPQGICDEAGSRLGVFEFCARGSLRGMLDAGAGLSFKPGPNSPPQTAPSSEPGPSSRPSGVVPAGLTWRERLSIALGTARGLAYLHDISRPPVLHQVGEPLGKRLAGWHMHA